MGFGPKQLENYVRSIIVQNSTIVEPVNERRRSDQLSVYLIWSARAPLLPGRTYQFNYNDTKINCTVSNLKYRLNPEGDERLAADTLNSHEIGYCNIEIDQVVEYQVAGRDGKQGRFTLHDVQSGDEIAAGLINFGLRRATNIQWQALEIGKVERGLIKNQKPLAVWFTGLSGSGKSTLAGLLDARLYAMGRHTYVMDGDNVRHGLCRDLGFTDADRVENIRRVAETAKLFVDAGLIVIASFISPFASERRMARELFEKGEFIEIFVDTPLDVCEQRDPKGLYKKARSGQIKNFTGLDSPYERPERAEIVLSAKNASPEEQVDKILLFLQQNS